MLWLDNAVEVDELPPPLGFVVGVLPEPEPSEVEGSTVDPVPTMVDAVVADSSEEDGSSTVTSTVELPVELSVSVADTSADPSVESVPSCSSDPHAAATKISAATATVRVSRFALLIVASSSSPSSTRESRDRGGQIQGPSAVRWS
jgi:hypothetical protein